MNNDSTKNGGLRLAKATQAVLAKIDAERLISGNYGVRLEGSGRFAKGLCPFHREAAPSFVLDRKTGLWACHGCGESGNAIDFVMKIEDVSFPAALEKLAGFAGLRFPKSALEADEGGESARKETLMALMKEAAKFYHATLYGKDREGLAYVEKRGLTPETIRRFGIGYAPRGNVLWEAFRDRWSLEDLREAGLVKVDEETGPYDAFRNRAIFPIMDVDNRVVGFGGRAIGDFKPKYLNSKENAAFEKRRNLYGLNEAVRSGKRTLLLCEGYVDVVSVNQAGFPEAVASLGTSLTEDHAKLLKRHADRVLLSYDSDGPGVKAAARAIPILEKAGLEVGAIDLKPWKDPDEFVVNEGREAFAERLEKAVPATLYVVRALSRLEGVDPDEAYEFAVKMLAGKPADLRARWVSAAAKATGWDERRLLAAVTLKATFPEVGR